MSNYVFPFEKLEVWQNAKNLTIGIYKLSSKFPKEELYGLTREIRRAVISISSNIAEGNSRISGKDQAHFTNIAYSSMMELLNQIILAHELDYISEEETKMLRSQVEKMSNQLNALRKYQLKR